MFALLRKVRRRRGGVAAPVSARAERDMGEGRQKREPRVRNEEGACIAGLEGAWEVWAREDALGMSGGKGGLPRGERSQEPQVGGAPTCRVIFSGPPEIGTMWGLLGVE